MKINSKIGAHVSIAGGIWKAPSRGKEEGCEVIQIFTRSPQGGPAPKIDDEIASKFKQEMITNNISDVYIHTPYYINLASENEVTRKSSQRVIREELERGSMIGAKYIMTHIGSAGARDRDEAVFDVGRGLAEAISEYNGLTKLLIEISAGAGSVLGCSFEEVRKIINAGNLYHAPGFGGICFDTCHAFASGYDFRDPNTLQETLEQFDKHIGLDWLKLTHVNDSKGELGDRKDRHEHIGEGKIGMTGTSYILRSEPFAKIDWILETSDDNRMKDIEMLRSFRIL